LLLTGYWPVIGTSLALATREGHVVLIVPEDERELAQGSWADHVYSFEAASLNDLRSAAEGVGPILAEAAKKLQVGSGRLGHEWGEAFEPASYAAQHLYGTSLAGLLEQAFPSAIHLAADELLAWCRAIKTPVEVERIRKACRIAGVAFQEGQQQIQPGLQETEVAAHFRRPLSTCGMNVEGVQRADGFVFCMSGPHSAQASGAYARSRSRRLQKGDLILVHCNSYADGYWTDVTRTYSLGNGSRDERQRCLHLAVLEARAQALEAIRPGVRASLVDHAARSCLRQRGFEKEFRHSTGHGVGFAAINHNAEPRLHPRSEDVLEVGMVFNVEPALYFENYGGLRHCDMVTVTPAGAEVLTPFHGNLEELLLSC
jgi:Xaa-Pro aminopeptidase